MRSFPNIGLTIPDILIPKPGVSLEKWAVVACDQFTSQPEYWNQVMQLTDGSPSTYNLILPEAYLEKPEGEIHQSKICTTMIEYLQADMFDTVNGLIYVERFLASQIRQGLIAALDLEQYDYQSNSTSLIRATEGTIIDRLPPRIKIRENAPLETPHIMVLIDDPEMSVIEPLANSINDHKIIYDFHLMMSGGKIRGYQINNSKIETAIKKSLEKLIRSDIQKQKYGIAASPLLFAVGDGNHSLATAKAIWERNKKNTGFSHPSRYALVELVNIHNPGLVFEPIHRLIRKLNTDIFKEMAHFFPGKILVSKVKDYHSMVNFVKNHRGETQVFGTVMKNDFRMVEIINPLHTLAVGSLQKFLDDLLDKSKDIEIDYIHGEAALLQLASQIDTIGFYLPVMEKDSLFKSVIKDGPLPRKTFSMGEAHEKRYYLECRKIQGA